MVAARKEDLKERARSLVCDLRNMALLEGKTTPELNLRFDYLEKKLVGDFCSQAPAWYNDNVKYKGAFQGLLRAVRVASTEVHDINSVLCKSLAVFSEGEPAAGLTSGAGTPIRGLSEPTSGAGTPIRGLSEPTVLLGSLDNWRSDIGLKIGEAFVGVQTHVKMTMDNFAHPAIHLLPASEEVETGSSNPRNKVAELHQKFHTDLGWTGARGQFYGDEVFRQGVTGIVGPMPRQLLRSIYAEHKQSKDSEVVFTAWNAGHKSDTTPSDEFDFVVGVEVGCITFSATYFMRNKLHKNHPPLSKFTTGHISCVTNCTKLW
jgi:hypothetical protein